MMYDVIIVGGGMAGFSAGLYASRACLKTVILEKQGFGGGQIAKTELVENYPGVREANGFDLAMVCRQQAVDFGAELIEGVEVTMMSLANPMKMVCTADGRTFYGKTVILAMGAEYRKLDVPGEKEFYGKGVSNCATCDGAFFKDRDVTVVGGGNAAVEEGTFLGKFADVTIVHRRDEFRAEQILQQRAIAHDRVGFLMNHVVEAIHGENPGEINARVTGVTLRNTVTGEIKERATDGVFVFVGMVPNTQLVAEQVYLDEQGYIPTDDSMRVYRQVEDEPWSASAFLKGVYAAGDVRKSVLRQAVTSAAEGAIAAVMAEKYLETLSS